MSHDFAEVIQEVEHDRAGMMSEREISPIDPADEDGEWPLRTSNGAPIDISMIQFDRRTPDSQAATLAQFRKMSPIDLNFSARHTPDSIAAAKRSRRSSITGSTDLSIGRFSFEEEKFPFEGELKRNLQRHVLGSQPVGDDGQIEHGDDVADEGDNESIYPKPMALILILVALCLAVFCVSLHSQARVIADKSAERCVST